MDYSRCCRRMVARPIHWNPPFGKQAISGAWDDGRPCLADLSAYIVGKITLLGWLVHFRNKIEVVNSQAFYKPTRDLFGFRNKIEAGAGEMGSCERLLSSCLALGGNAVLTAAILSFTVRGLSR
jgi:hypothetical protein